MFLEPLEHSGSCAAAPSAHIRNMFCGCFLYADDIIILSPSIKGLQAMLDTCMRVSKSLFLSFNFLKSHCIMFGKRVSNVEPMWMGTHSIPWVDSIRYLGVHIVSGKRLMFDVNPTKRSFYCACNCIYSHSHSLDEIIQLSLQESYCLPLLTFASPALSLSSKQIRELNVCWNSVYRTIFGFNVWESVRCFINGLGRLNLMYILNVRRSKFYMHLTRSNNTVLYNLFWLHCYDYFNTDDCLNVIHLSPTEAIDFWYQAYADECIN
jgi:hypothetical protein